MKKIIALVLALTMVLVVAVASANTINITNAAEGETYNIYKLLDLHVDDENDPEAFTYTINSKWSGFWTSGEGANYIDTNTLYNDTYVVWKTTKQSAADMEAFGKAAAAYAAANGITPDKTEITADSASISFTGLDDGYYMITSSLGIAVTVGSTPANVDQDIREKNETSNSDKDVKEDSTNTYGKTNDAQVGDTIEFKAVVNIAKNSINVAYHDTMDSQLDWTGVDNVAVYTDAACTTPLAAANWSVAAGSGTETFVVSFEDAYVATLTAATTPLYITYTAILNDSALIDDSIHNTQKVTWGDSGEYQGEPTTTKTYKFILKKVDGVTQKLIAGAKFQLFTSETGGTALKLAKNNDGTVYRVYRTAADLPSGFTATEDDKIVTLSTQTIDVVGVDADSYWLEETDAPLGYTPLEGRTEVVVDATNAVLSPIENFSGTVLPSTGGIGTTIFYILGGLLVVGAAVILVARRKAQD